MCESRYVNVDPWDAAKFSPKMIPPQNQNQEKFENIKKKYFLQCPENWERECWKKIHKVESEGDSGPAYKNLNVLL